MQATSPWPRANGLSYLFTEEITGDVVAALNVKRARSDVDELSPLQFEAVVNVNLTPAAPAGGEMQRMSYFVDNARVIDRFIEAELGCSVKRIPGGDPAARMLVFDITPHDEAEIPGDVTGLETLAENHIGISSIAGRPGIQAGLQERLGKYLNR